MKTKFDKIYVISLISNKDRQEFIKYQMNELGIDFEFVYGIDFHNLKYDRLGNKINYPNLSEFNHLDNYNTYSCAIAHYQAVLQAYEFEYMNVLIIEDDTCFIKDKSILENYLNDIPTDADFITYIPRFYNYYESDNFYNEINLEKKYIKLNNYLKSCGAGMYGLMNRKTIELYLSDQRNKFDCADHINHFYENPSINRYAAVQAIATDQFNLNKKGLLTEENINKGFFCYIQKNIINDYDDFYKPLKFNLSNINIYIQNENKI